MIFDCCLFSMANDVPNDDFAMNHRRYDDDANRPLDDVVCVNSVRIYHLDLVKIFDHFEVVRIHDRHCDVVNDRTMMLRDLWAMNDDEMTSDDHDHLGIVLCNDRLSMFYRLRRDWHSVVSLPVLNYAMNDLRVSDFD